MAAILPDQLIPHTRFHSHPVPRNAGEGVWFEARTETETIPESDLLLTNPVAAATRPGMMPDADMIMSDYRKFNEDADMAADAQPVSPSTAPSHFCIHGNDEPQDQGSHHGASLGQHMRQGNNVPSSVSFGCSPPSLSAFYANASLPQTRQVSPRPGLEHMPNEVLLHILGFVDVCDLVSTSRVNHVLRKVSLAPILHTYRLRHTRQILSPLLTSLKRPSLDDLIARQIFLTPTTIISRRLTRSLVSIRLSRRLATRPSAEVLVERSVLPRECVPGMVPVYVAPGLAARRKAIEHERLKDGLRSWIAAKWRREVRQRAEDARKRDETHGVGRVWRLTKFWERMSRDEHFAF